MNLFLQIDFIGLDNSSHIYTDLSGRTN